MSKRDWLKHLGFTTAAAIAISKITPMANEPTIDDKNGAIAIFNGYQFFKGDPNHKCNFCFAGDEPCTPAVDRFVKDCKIVFYYELKYHTSWDWLMPVWKKAGKILFDIRGDLIGENYLDAHRITKAFIDACQKAEIENAHGAVYNAIQLISGYNQQKQKDGEV